MTYLIFGHYPINVVDQRYRNSSNLVRLLIQCGFHRRDFEIRFSLPKSITHDVQQHPKILIDLDTLFSTFNGGGSVIKIDICDSKIHEILIQCGKMTEQLFFDAALNQRNYGTTEIFNTNILTHGKKMGFSRLQPIQQVFIFTLLRMREYHQ